MSVRVTLSLDRSDYSGLDDVAGVSVILTQKRLAMLVSLFLLADNRLAWDDMSDTDWDNLQALVAQILEVLYD